MKPSRLPPSGPAGFTLMELLVATAATALLGVLLLTVVQGISSSYSRIKGNVVREGDISFALDQLTQDVEGLVLPNTTGAEALRINTDTGIPTLPEARWLTLLATITDSDTVDPAFEGATRAVSYRLAFQNTISQTPAREPTYGIYRAVASSRDTFDNALDVANLQQDFWSGFSPSPTDEVHLLAENIVGFQLRFQYFDADGNEQWTAPGDEIRITRGASSVNGTTIPGTFQRVEISVTALSPDGAKRLQNGDLTLDEAITRHGKTSVRQAAFFGM